MKKGEIYWAVRTHLKKSDPNYHMQHPIICLEDCDLRNPPDKFKAAIISKSAAEDSAIKNVEMPLSFFEEIDDNKKKYQVPWEFPDKPRYLVQAGFLKPYLQMRQKPSGKIKPKKVQWVEKQLLNANVKYEYIPYTIKEYAKIKTKQQKSV